MHSGQRFLLKRTDIIPFFILLKVHFVSTVCSRPVSLGRKVLNCKLELLFGKNKFSEHFITSVVFAELMQRENSILLLC